MQPATMIPSPLVRHKTISAQTFSHQPLAHHHDPGAAQIITIPCKRIGPSSLQSHLEQWYGPGNYSVESEGRDEHGLKSPDTSVQPLLVVERKDVLGV
ncbi:hypothetical protein QC762_703130 [Podospora pseudocomata]|uniref:Uncharacterized protein n=1 Tax=Podospora pseudocomata TaxID=2093779 RepID=A0ABR0G300_9PEZI|nr:hypothetical protein QC762_703130 [Podospora pseudocomata]